MQLSSSPGSESFSDKETTYGNEKNHLYDQKMYNLVASSDFAVWENSKDEKRAKMRQFIDGYMDVDHAVDYIQICIKDSKKAWFPLPSFPALWIWVADKSLWGNCL